MICIECGGTAFGGGELCEFCSDTNGMASNLSLQSAMASAINVCGACSGTVNANNSRLCSNCKKYIHYVCDPEEASLDSFYCITCRKSPLLSGGEIMLNSTSSVTRDHDEPIGGMDLQLLQNETVASFTQPNLPSTQRTEFNDIYQTSHQTQASQSQIIEEINDCATNDSARNSPFYGESSDIDEDFVPGTNRGRGRGGAKKKPGRGSSLKKQSTVQSTSYSTAQLQSLTQPTRGKRGKRGTKVPGKSGGRGRGRGRASAAAAAMQQQTYQNIMQANMMNSANSMNLIQSTIREIDETMIDDETSRQSAATRADDAEYVRTIVIAKVDDVFLQQTCLCLICGAVGRGPESSMVACSNCAQTYHTYCVGLHEKLNSTVIFRGWRCLDCTVCEGCGNGGDDSKLLLCEECDISYHIYCLQPPLEQIPNGPWRCQWCARCRRCNVKVQLGSDLTRDGLCHPCNSLRKCPKCTKGYSIGDKIIRCSQCHKWQHGICENLYNDEMLEQAAMNRMRCTACRPNKNQALTGFSDPGDVVICDNVALSKGADEVFKSKFTPSLCRPSYETYGYREFDHYGDDDAFNPPDADFEANTIVQRGRGRGNPSGRRGGNKIGIGGFYAKLPRHRIIALAEEAVAMNNMDEEDVKKMKRPRKPRRSQLEDAYPPAIQEAFFGIKAVEGKTLVDMSVEEPSLLEYGNGKTMQNVVTGHELSKEATEMLRDDINENQFLENMDLHEMDGDLDKVDLSILFNDDEYDDDFEDSLTGLERDGNDDLEENKPFPATTFSMDQQPSSSTHNEQPSEVQNGQQHQMEPQPSPAYIKLSTSSRGVSNDAPERYQFSERWEEDEPLGLQATTAAVLYANEKHTHLKEQFPVWADRVKQIQKLWRVLNAEERQDYVNRARENRTNRGRQPRLRRINAQSNSVDSPTSQSPAPLHGGEFKVPNAPDEGQERFVRITCHLTPETYQQYRMIMDKLSDLEKVMVAIDADLAKQRKMKKNLAAKKRQMQKTFASVPENDGKTIDLNETDKLALTKLTDSIKVLQAESENTKRELKLHEASVRDFEYKNGIIKNESEVTPQMIEKTNLMNQQAVAADSDRVQMLRHQMQQQQQMIHGQVPMRVPQQIPFGGPGPMNPQQHEMMRRMQIQQQRRAMRSMLMGGVNYSHITDPIEKEVYEVLDDVLIHISLIIDGPPRENPMLKRLLDNNNGSQLPSTSYEVVEQPRPKKKRTIQKKTAQAYPSGSEYDSWLERMRTRFRLCQEIPKKAKEPPLKNPGAAFAGMGISEIHVKPDRRTLSGPGFGEMTLSYVDDYFTGSDRTSKALFQKFISMHDVCPNANFMVLYDQPHSPDEDFIVDDYEEKPVNYQPLSVLATWLNQQRGNPLEHIRSQSKMFDVSPPIEPLRRMFYSDHKDEDVEVTITAQVEDVKEENGEVKSGTGKMVEELKKMLGITNDIEIRFDTPPVSPSLTPNKKDDEEKDQKDIKMEVEDQFDPQVSNTKVKKEMEVVCKHCSKNIEGTNAFSQKMGKLGILASDAPEEACEELASFCSRKCYYELMATSKISLSQEEINAAEAHVDEETFNRLKQIHADNLVKVINLGKSRLACAPSVSLEGMISPKDTRFMMDEGGRKDNVTAILVSSLSKNTLKNPEPPKSASDEWKPYSADMQQSFRNLQNIHQKFVALTKMGVPKPPYELDQRQCILCGGVGDGETSKCGRLLSLSEYIWTHVNCALWSTEVFENNTGGLMHVDRAIIRASKVGCAFCGRAGASIKCHKMDCNLNFHLLCAQQAKGYFIKDRTFICQNHDPVAQGVTVTRLDALRRIYIQRDENELLAKMFELSDGPKLCLRLGALSFYKIGQILPDQLKSFHNAHFIYPNGYRVTRWFWSPKDYREAIRYECVIREKDNKPWFVVKSIDDPTLCVEGETASAAWSNIFQGVLHLRQAVDMLRFFTSHIHGETLYGLNENVITKITESLPGVDTIYDYNIRHQNSPILELPLAENPMGCARAEPRQPTNNKYRPRTKPSATASPGGAVSKSKESRSGRTRGCRTNFMEEQAAAQFRALGLSAEYAAVYMKGLEPIQGSHQVFTAYQKMRKEWKNTVYLARSKIQGFGLYAKRDIAMGDFIIEYKGEIIRSEVGEVREKRYNAQHRGVYMFRIDEELIIDATDSGGPARYINHSCDPNCSTRILDAGSGPADKKIIITANRPIMAEEELTYDYQFELEDSSDKIPCLCGAPNCVKWMN